jgi:2-oxoglutarate dehydrogenase E2 component (dihydrolipoamide succinyltransferase)
MAIEIKVPVLPESVADATIATWHKQVGDTVERDENLVDIETDKVVLEVVAPDDGILESIIKNEGDTVLAQEVIAAFTAGAGAAPTPAKDAPKSTPEPAPVAAAAPDAGPAARRMMAEQNVQSADLSGSGKRGRIVTDDVVKPKAVNGHHAPAVAPLETTGDRTEKRVPMSRLRKRIAERLISAQQNAAILTTFNEVNMQPVMELRKQYKDKFEKTHGVKLGFMSFFAKAAIEALKRFPVVNASLDNDDVVYHGYYDLGVAVSSPRGLVVPVLRDAEHLSMAEIEKNIYDLGIKARDGKLSMEEMTGGTFTLSNGGVFGSLLSTPILNPPQTGILGMHKIEERPVVEKGQIVIRPMMYLALSYDHRIIDGKESVSFLVAIKELLEDPARLLLEI